MRPDWENECVSKSALIEWLRPYLHTGEPIPADVLISDIQMMPPTLTPQNEWISVEDRLPEPGDLIVYADNTVWGYQYGICRVCGKEKAFDYWMPLQDPPNNRPPEGEDGDANHD